MNSKFHLSFIGAEITKFSCWPSTDAIFGMNRRLRVIFNRLEVEPSAIQLEYIAYVEWKHGSDKLLEISSSWPYAGKVQPNAGHISITA